jgi:phosphatidylinositol alpha-1,6-mannosyltransferase
MAGNISRRCRTQIGGRVSLSIPHSALVLTPKAFGADGVSALTRLVASTLLQAGVDTRVLALERESRRDMSDGPLEVPVESAEGGKLRFVLNGLKAIPRARRPEIVIAIHLRMLPAALPLMAGGVPVMTFLLGVECWRPLSRRDRSLVSRSSLLLPISQWTRERFLAANPEFTNAAMSVCPPGVDSTIVATHEPIPGRALVVGRLWSEERYKGHDLLIDTWPAIRNACPNAHLMIVGDGDDRARLEQRVRSAGLSSAIQFAGLVSQEQLRRHFNEAQVFVLPSEGEGFGIVFLEAMRASRPCIAARGAAEEIVLDGLTGRIVAARDGEALARTLTPLLRDRELADVMGRAGRRRLEEEYSAARFSGRFLGALQQTATPC